jgi:hypothetical protein
MNVSSTCRECWKTSEAFDVDPVLYEMVFQEWITAWDAWPDASEEFCSTVQQAATAKGDDCCLECAAKLYGYKGERK